ncbi:MAG: NUDIX hydrolase [Edaphobacter sp.]|uniref:NUDIX hydrolase n=1 Tax=Edaphobacter sp. TaxID=1934404 RepID=UPI002383CDE9|nr:NUDIX hydrolase [Edaphobacter sp.]MDE1176086.1 NUDIX hydrolase [Edaphobacter sp.]
MTAPSDEVRTGREYPRTPIAGVAAVVLCEGDILLIRRGRAPMLGAWSLPGGALELGETSAEGAVREVLEETGIRVRPIDVITSIDRIHRDATGRVQFHYVLVEWLCIAGEHTTPICGDDAAEAAWVSRQDVFSAAYDLGTATLSVIQKALIMAETIER